AARVSVLAWIVQPLAFRGVFHETAPPCDGDPADIQTRKGPSVLCSRRGRPGVLRSTCFYPVGPLVSRLSSAHAKKALDEFKAFVVSVSARVWLKPDSVVRVCRSAREYLCAADIAV